MSSPGDMYRPTPDARSPHYRLVDDDQRANWRRRGSRRVAAGAVWLAAGILITAITLANSPASGFYVIAFGPVIGGVAQMISGARMHGRGRGSS